MEIDHIMNVGCYKNVSKIDLGRNMFIYGLNGVGKSTFKRLIQLGFKENSKLIGSYGIKKSLINAKFNILGKTAEFKSGAIIQKINNVDLHVFDDDYIQNTIFENGLINDDNKNNYYNILVGKSISEKVKNLNEKSLSNQDLCKDLDKLILNLETELILLKNIYQNHNNISEILKFNFQTVKIVENSFNDEILKNISKLGEIEARWLNDGLQIRRFDDVCPFCGQDIDESLQNRLINKYKSITIKYSEPEDSALEIISNYMESINTLISLENKVYIETKDDVLQDLQDILDKCYEKQEDLTKIINLNSTNSIGSMSRKSYHIENQISALRMILQKYRITDMFNITIDEDAENKYRNLRTSINNLFVNEEDANDILYKISQIRKLALICNQKIIDINYNQGILINSNLNFINDKFEEYNFKYKLDFKNIQHKILTKTNSFILNLSLIPNENLNHEIKFEKKYVKESLSEGEKSIIAWIIFLCEIKNQLNQKRHMIILDDPISSYDSYRRFNLIFDLEDIFLKNTADKEILLLTHEKSFTNSAKLISSMNFYNLQNDVFSKVKPDEIIENDMKNDIEFIRNHTILENNESLIEFLVRSRNLIEYSYINVQIFKTKYFKKTRYNQEKNNVSSVLHMRNHVLSKSYIEYIENVYEKLVRNSIRIDTSNIDLDNINVCSLLPTSTANPYLNRVILDNYLQNILTSNGKTIPYTATTGDLLRDAKHHISEDKYKKIKLIIPILNIYNHPNLNYGVRRIDIDNKKLELVKKIVDEVII